MKVFKSYSKRIITLLLAVIMAVAMPISINAAEGPIEPMSLNANEAMFQGDEDLYFVDEGDFYGTIHFTEVYTKDSANTYTLKIYPDIVWDEKLPLNNGSYTVKLTLTAQYQRLNHWTYGSVIPTPGLYKGAFTYSQEKTGLFRIPETTFSITPPTIAEDSFGFSFWISFSVEVDIFAPGADTSDNFNSLSFATFLVNASDVKAEIG